MKPACRQAGRCQKIEVANLHINIKTYKVLKTLQVKTSNPFFSTTKIPKENRDNFE
jgi:hypothetical protein